MFYVQEKVIDPFVIYNSTVNYSSLKELLNEALHAKQIDKLTDATEVLSFKGLIIYY